MWFMKRVEIADMAPSHEVSMMLHHDLCLRVLMKPILLTSEELRSQANIAEVK